MNKDVIRKVYDAMSKEYGMAEDFDTFAQDIQNKDVARRVYDAMYDRYRMEEDFEEFYKDLTFMPSVDGVKTTESGSVVVDEAPKQGRITLADTLNASVSGMVSSGYTEEVKEEQEKNMLTQEERDQRAAMRQRLQEDGTIDRMKESRKEARREKLRAFGSMLGSTPQVTSFGVSTNVFDSTDEQLADVGQALDAGTEYRQNKLLQEKLDVALDMARAGENQDGLRGVENFGLGLWDSATRLSTWDFGASDIVNNLTLQQIVEKWENDPSSLTATEQKVLEGIGMATAVQELYSDQVGVGYNVGQSLPESAGFMASMALNPASGLGKSLARNAVRTYGRNSIAKNLARIGGDIAETAIMTATTGAGRVAADALERINGSSTYEIGGNGVIMYGGQKDQETVGDAVLKAIGSNFIENYSEALGEYFDPLLGMSRKVAAGGLRKMNLNKWADALSDVQPSQMTASIRSLREKTKFGGIFGEIMEEEIGMALNTLFVGDNKWSDFADLETQLTTVLSCAIMSGTLNGVEQVSNVAARRKMEKNARDAELEASYRFTRKEFAPLREAIDQASPESMVDVLRDVYMSQEYTVGQKRALAEYAAARLQLQYYNAADAKARRQVNKTQQELLDAQEAGLNAQLPQLFNIARAAQFAEDELLDYDGDFNLVDIIRSSMNRPEEMERILGDIPPREAELVKNYIYTRARMEGAYQGRSNRVEDYIDDVAYALEPAVVTDADGNRTITTAILGDRSVYVLENNGDLAHIMRPDGSKTLVKASELTNITTSSAEEVMERYRSMYAFEYDAETENAFEHHPKTQAPQVGLQLQSPEGEVVITAVNDNMVEIVPAVYKDGQVQPKEGAEPRTITVDDAYAWQDDYYLSMDADQAYANAMAEASNVSAETTENEGTPSEQIEQSVSEEVTDGQNVGIQPTEEVAESVAPAAPQTARERVPKDEEGNPIYEQTDADTAWDAIVEETEGDTEMAQRVAVDMLADKKSALAKLQKGKPKKGTTVAEKIANEKAHAAAIAQAQNDVAQWEAIVGTEARRREAAMSEADRYAAEMEQKNISEGLAALGEPQSLEEYVLGQLAGGAYKLRWSDKENGTKGFGSHTGLSTEEMKARLSMIDNKNGLTPEEVAHVIVENMDSSFGEVDVMDVTNMVIDAVATNASRRAMLDGMVESRAELMRQQARAEQEAKDAWYMEQYHATEEELAAYREYLAEITEEIIADDANYEERFNTFAELIADEYDNQGTDADIRSSADQGERLASDSEGSSSVGEGEETDRQGANLGDAPRFAEAEDGRAGSSVSAQSDVDAEAEEWAEATIQRIRELEDEIANIEDVISEFEAGERSYIVDAEIAALEDRLKDAIAERDGLLSLAEENNEGADFKSRQKKGTPAGVRVLDGKSKRASEEYAHEGASMLTDEDFKTIEEDSRNAITAEIERESAALGVPVRIARSVDELPDEDTRKRAVDGKLKGYFDPRTGEVVLYEPNTENANDAKRTILHEIVGHKGFRSLIGEQRYDKAMLQLMYMLPSEVRDAVLRRAERHGWNAAIAMDEYLAEQAERDVQPTWWGKVNAKIRALLRNMGFNVMLTDADVTYLLWRSRKKLQGDDLNDMAVNAILKQAARKSAEAEAWNEQAFQDAEMRDFERSALPSIRHRMGADVNDYEKAVRTLGFKQAEAWQDSMRSLLVFQQAIAKASGKDISDFENAYMYENRMSSANLMEMEQYRHMVYNPLLKEIHEMEQMGASRESIINYLFAKSGLERNEVFARRDAKKHAEGDAAKEQQLYDKYRQKDYAGLTALTRGDAQIAALVDDHSKKKTEYERLEQNKKRGVAVSDADLSTAKKEMNDARKAMITAIEAEAQRMVDEFEAQHNTDNLWDKIRNCTHTTLNISHDAGVMSDEVYNELWNQFQYYIPLRGFAETTAEDVYLYLGGNDSPYNAPIKTAYGRTSLADDPIATIGNMAESAIVEANRNRLKQRFLYMVERHNTDLASISDVWLEYDDVNDEWHTVFAQIPDDATPSEAKRLQQEFEDRMKLLAEQNPGKYANAIQQPNIPYRVVKKGDRQEHHVIVKRNGKDVVITINGNPRVAQAINGLTNPEQNNGPVQRIVNWVNRNLSANFTMRNPAFMVSNFVRDGFYTNSMVWVKENPAYARQYNKNWAICTAQIASLVGRYKRYEKGDTTALDMNNDMDRMFYEFMINGGETGYTVIKSVEDYKGLISGEMKKMEAGAMGTARRVADTICNVVDTFGRWAEDTSRFAAYMTSRQLGRTITKSIWDAKEISVNFNKKGSGNRMMGKFEQGNRWNYVLSNMSQLGRNLYVFWNAGMQGLNNFSKAAKKSPAKFTAMAGTYFTLGVIVAAAFSGDDDEDDYYNLPEYVRRNNICFKIGKGKYATLPLPIEIRAIYGLGELAYSYLSGREGLTHGEAVTKTIQQMTQVMPIDMMADGGGAMALVPSAAKPVVEVAFNVDWTGRPIYKEKTPWNQNDPTWTLAFKSTSPELIEMSRLVNEWTNKNTADGLERPYNRGWADNRYLNNPAVWEHIMEGYLGGMATMFNQTKKTLMMPFNEDLREVRNVPIASRFIKDAGKEGRSYAARNEYYDAKNIMDSWKNEMSKAKKEVLDESLTDEQRLKAAKLRSSLEQQYMEAAERWKVLDRQRKALEEAYKSDQSEENRQALDDVMMQMATLVEAYRD